MTVFEAVDDAPPAGTKLIDRLGRIWWPLCGLRGVVRWQCNDGDSSPKLWRDMSFWAPFRTTSYDSPTVTPEVRMWALDFALRAVQVVAETHGTFDSPEGTILAIADNYIGYVMTGEHFE